ncbi:MAG: hypothetical protein ACP5G1_01180 [Nanopusillaceae archaeon]
MVFLVISILLLIASVLLFLQNYINKDPKINIASALNKIDKYKKYLYLAIFFIIFVQILLSTYRLFQYNTSNYHKYMYTFSLIFSVVELFVLYKIYKKNISTRFHNFTDHLLLTLSFLEIFVGLYFLTFRDFYAFLLHTRYIPSLIFLIAGIHYGLYRLSNKVMKKGFGITLAILFLLQLFTGELLEFSRYEFPVKLGILINLINFPNASIVWGTIHGFVLTVAIIIFIYLHAIIKK